MPFRGEVITTHVDIALRDIYQTAVLAPPPSPASSDLFTCLAQRKPHALQSVLGPRGPYITKVCQEIARELEEKTNLSPFGRLRCPTCHTNPLRGRRSLFLGLGYIILGEGVDCIGRSNASHLFLGRFVLVILLQTGGI